MHRLAGRPGPALDLQRSALDRIERGGTDAGARMRTVGELGLAQLAHGDVDASVETLTRAVDLFARLQPRMTPEQSDALQGLGLAHLARGRAAAALPPLERADRFWREVDASNRGGLEAAEGLARCYASLGREAAAVAALGRVRAVQASRPE